MTTKLIVVTVVGNADEATARVEVPNTAISYAASRAAGTGDQQPKDARDRAIAAALLGFAYRRDGHMLLCNDGRWVYMDAAKEEHVVEVRGR